MSNLYSILISSIVIILQDCFLFEFFQPLTNDGKTNFSPSSFIGVVSSQFWCTEAQQASEYNSFELSQVWVSSSFDSLICSAYQSTEHMVLCSSVSQIEDFSLVALSSTCSNIFDYFLLYNELSFLIVLEFELTLLRNYFTTCLSTYFLKDIQSTFSLSFSMEDEMVLTSLSLSVWIVFIQSSDFLTHFEKSQNFGSTCLFCYEFASTQTLQKSIIYPQTSGFDFGVDDSFS